VRIVISMIVVLFIFITPAFTFKDQITTERVVKDNEYFLFFLNVCITNFGDQKMIDRLKEIYQKHFNGQIAYLQSDYPRCYKNIYESQKKQVSLFADITLNLYLKDAKNILDSMAPSIISSKDVIARKYLSLGYRSRTVGKNHYIIGDASNPKICSYIINRYIKAIKKIRRSKKYAFLSLFKSQEPEIKKKIYNHLFRTEQGNGNPFYSRFMNKEGDSFLKEINRTFEDYRESSEVALVPEQKEDKAIDNETLKQDEKQFEPIVSRKVRFRTEISVARGMLFSEFKKTENYIRKYITDFNFKIIKATIEVVSSKSKEGKRVEGDSIYNIHHIDNYARLSKKSLLLAGLEFLKVEDDTIIDEYIDGEEQDKEIEGNRDNESSDSGVRDISKEIVEGDNNKKSSESRENSEDLEKGVGVKGVDNKK